MFIAEQGQLKARLEQETDKVAALTQQLESLPSPEEVAAKSAAIRKQLLEQIEDRNWRKLSFDEIHQFLIYLFGENPGKTGTGIKLTFENGKWRIAFKGNVEFKHDLLDGKGVKAQSGRTLDVRVVATIFSNETLHRR